MVNADGAQTASGLAEEHNVMAVAREDYDARGYASAKTRSGSDSNATIRLAPKVVAAARWEQNVLAAWLDCRQCWSSKGWSYKRKRGRWARVRRAMCRP